MPPFTHLEFHRSGIGLVPQGTSQSDTAIYVANRRVFRLAESHDDYTGMGTTIV